MISTITKPAFPDADPRIITLRRGCGGQAGSPCAARRCGAFARYFLNDLASALDRPDFAWRVRRVSRLPGPSALWRSSFGLHGRL